MNENHVKNAAVDGLLSDYFRAQMPDPWPPCQASQAKLPRRVSRWLTFTRFAVAASVGLLLAGYLALAGMFPREPASKINQDRNIGRHTPAAATAPANNR
jgi:hypothetical protein